MCAVSFYHCRTASGFFWTFNGTFGHVNHYHLSLIIRVLELLLAWESDRSGFDQGIFYFADDAVGGGLIHSPRLTDVEVGAVFSLFSPSGSNEI